MRIVIASGADVRRVKTMHGEDIANAYGFWTLVIVNAGLLVFFLLSFLAPTKKREWRSMGITTAFIVALFTEMYGFPLTIYMLTAWLGNRYPAINPFSHASGHLWLTFLGGGPAMMTWIHVISNGLMIAGFWIMASAWQRIHAAKGELVTNGPYRYVRHPQYSGLFLIIIGLLIQWPTIITALMSPIMFYVYYSLSIREEAEIEAIFGDLYRQYRAATPMFFPKIGDFVKGRKILVFAILLWGFLFSNSIIGACVAPSDGESRIGASPSRSPCSLGRYPLTCSWISAAQELTGREILDRVEKLLWGRTSQGLSEMTIIAPRWQRTLLMRVWMDRPDKTFVRILSPAKETGIGSLRIKTEMWNYLPSVERVIKIPPSMMLQPWMGSDFTNDDLVKESSIVNDYTHTILGIDKIEGVEVYKIEAIPKPDAPVVWGKLIYLVRKKDLIPLKQEFYNERGELIKVMTFTDIRQMGGRIIPTRWEMRSIKKEGNVTIVTLKEMVFDRPIDQEIFSLRSLQKIQ